MCLSDTTISQPLTILPSGSYVTSLSFSYFAHIMDLMKQCWGMRNCAKVPSTMTDTQPGPKWGQGLFSSVVLLVN